MIQVRKEILQHAEHLFKNQKAPNSKYTLMVSGGVDSIVMAHYFINKVRKDDVMVYHFNHKLRPQNNRMEKKVVSFCKDFDIKLHIDKATHIEKDFAKREGDLRRMRFTYIRSYNTIAITAHHSDDVVESYLRNAFEGHADYLPIPFATVMNCYLHAGTSIVAHPFLFNRKKKFIEYAEKHDLMKYVEEDETNKIVKGSRRNMIRNLIVPTLRQHDIVLNKMLIRNMGERLKDRLNKDLIEKIKNGI